ncbi:Long-chain-fatty-acid--CoA ligase 1 [Nymphon striatum]|nr:Long-chain-fatty-acid--CoA ligase 1 [Nymphon striatum]
MSDYLSYVGGVSGAVAITSAAAITGAAALSGLYIAMRPTPFHPELSIDHQSRVLKGSERVRISQLQPNENDYIDYIYDDVKTLHDSLQRGARLSNNGPCLGYRPGKGKPYKWISYNQALERIKHFGAGMIKLGLKPNPETFIGMYSLNRPEWVMTEYSCFRHSMVIIPLYDTLGPQACTYIINQTEMTAVVCDMEEKVAALLKEKSSTPSLKIIIHINDISEEMKKDAVNKGVQIISFTEVEELGKNNPTEPTLPSPEDLCTICYTSGTTGNPKGVMLTHLNMVSTVSAGILQIGSQCLKPGDILFSFLPLAHMFERTCEAVAYATGAAVGFYSGDIRLLIDDYKALKPTASPTVPRLLNRVYDKVTSEANKSPVKKYILKVALKMKGEEIRKGIIRKNSIWDKLIFNKIQAGMGGNLRLLIVASAPLAPDILTFARCALGCMVIEAYGQTECVAPITLNIPGDGSVGHVGPPIPCCSVKLVDVPEMEYFSERDQGEVCVKGLNTTPGYYKDPVKTAELIDEDGWLHTGDIGMWLPNGGLKIVDRKKHIFKLSQGEYIAPEKIEGCYMKSQYVSQLFVHGESLKSCLVAIVVAEKPPVMKYCKDNNINGTWEEICQNQSIKSLIINDLTSFGKKEGLKSFEQVKDIYIYPDVFTIEGDLLTPTLKTKRPVCRKYFMPQIEAMYRTLA